MSEVVVGPVRAVLRCISINISLVLGIITLVANCNRHSPSIITILNYPQTIQLL